MVNTMRNLTIVYHEFTELYQRGYLMLGHRARESWYGIKGKAFNTNAEKSPP
jgi:hypothetical protein